MPKVDPAAVIIGRFQPFHNGHAALLAQALAIAPRVVMVLGSAFQARGAKDPFSCEERAAMIAATLADADRARVHFVPVRDCYDDRQWARNVMVAVHSLTGDEAAVSLLGHQRDLSSAYLRRFPLWTFVDGGWVADADAGEIRRNYFTADGADNLRAALAPVVPPAVWDYLHAWRQQPHYLRLRDEHQQVAAERKKWGVGPFNTVDAVVRAADHVLLVRRARIPGKGLWALPGGFLESRERVLAGAIRELHEETNLALTESELEDALRGVAVFDDPDRSVRGRAITHAHYFDLDCKQLPQIAAADDAAAAQWVPVASLAAMESALFEDHFQILNHFLRLTD